jgi:integrase
MNRIEPGSTATTESPAESWPEVVPERDRALVLLLGLAGLRIGEATALQVGDVDFMRRSVKITKAASEVNGQVIVGLTKTGGNRAVPLPSVVTDALSAHLGPFHRGRMG